MKKIIGFLKSKTGIALIAIVVIGGGWLMVKRSQKTTYQFVPVTRGSITEVVSVTGNVTSTNSVDLGFQNGGTIASVRYQQGDSVPQGATIAVLDTSQLEAQLAQAQANVQTQQATLENLQAGATPQSIAVSETALNAARQTLKNSYASVPNAVAGAYTSANDAVRNQLSSFFTNAETNDPQLTFQVSNSQIVNNIEAERQAMSLTLNSWQTAIQNISSTAPSSTMDAALVNGLANAGQAKTLLATALSAIVNSANVSPTLEAAYKTDITNGMNELNASIGSMNSLTQSISSEKASVAQAQAQLDLTLSGSTPQEIDAQKAQVAQAQANVQAIQAQIANSYLIAPMSGVITTQNAKIGEIATPGVPLVSMISPNSLEIDADIPEVDISKIALNDKVSITLDAFPNETFTGKVFFIDPAETVLSGVVDYEVKIAFDKKDARLKSGLTANLNIMAQTDSNVLILPQYAILQNTNGAFVETILNGGVTTTPVTLGISDNNGNVEVTSGVSEGERVINIGLK